MARPGRSGPAPAARVEAAAGDPLVLAVETGSAFEVIALAQGSIVLGQSAVRRPAGRGAGLVPRIASLLEHSGRRADALSALAVGIGPGAFGGLRVGISACQGLARALGVPLFPFESPTVWARPGSFSAVTLDARRQEVVGALYRHEGAWPPRTILAPQIWSPGAWGEQLLTHGGPWRLEGDGARLHEATIRAHATGAVLSGEIDSGPPDLGAVARTVAAWIGEGRLPPPGIVTPTYLRGPTG